MSDTPRTNRVLVEHYTPHGDCWFFHQWGKWAMLKEGKLKHKRGGVVALWMMQERTCSRCGKVERESSTNF